MKTTIIKWSSLLQGVSPMELQSKAEYIWLGSMDRSQTTPISARGRKYAGSTHQSIEGRMCSPRDYRPDIRPQIKEGLVGVGRGERALKKKPHKLWDARDCRECQKKSRYGWACEGVQACKWHGREQEWLQAASSIERGTSHSVIPDHNVLCKDSTVSTNSVVWEGCNNIKWCCWCITYFNQIFDPTKGQHWWMLWMHACELLLIDECVYFSADDWI